MTGNRDGIQCMVHAGHGEYMCARGLVALASRSRYWYTTVRQRVVSVENGCPSSPRPHANGHAVFTPATAATVTMKKWGNEVECTINGRHGPARFNNAHENTRLRPGVSKYVLLNRRVNGIANVATAMTTSTPYISRSEKL